MNIKEKLIATAIGSCIGMILGVAGVLSIQEYFRRYTWTVQSPVIIRTPVVVKKSVDVKPTEKPKIYPTTKVTPTTVPTYTPTPKKRTLVPVALAADTTKNAIWSDKEIADYIKSKDWDYSIAIRLAKSENFWNLNKRFDCGRVGKQNSNGSYDYGIFQINTIHRAKVEDWYSMPFEKAMTNCKRNIDFAYKIYESRGNWSAWSAFNNGSYLNHTEEI